MPSEIEQICQRFEWAWQQGQPRDLEAELQSGRSVESAELLAKLLKIEIHYRQLRGEQPTCGEYLERFPESGSVIRAVFEPTIPNDETRELKTGPPSETIDFSSDLFSRPTASDPQPTSAAGTNGQRQSIGRYTVIGLLGRGGQADVYRAVHPTLPMEVAIKLTHATLPEHARATLLAEAHILCDLDHPHIARIRDLDFENGRPFMVLDFIRGRSLGQVAASVPFSPTDAAAVVAKVARAIGFAHAAGVIHRDLKPDNVVIDATGEPKIIDFGMSRLRSGLIQDIDERNEVSGTLAYMAPEQARGIAQNIDHRVDIFALGAILYRLLVGQAPYTTQSLAMMLATVREGGWDLQSLENCPVPEELKAICRKALNFDPDQRFRSAESLATALDHFASATTRIAGAGSTIPATQGPAGRRSVRKLVVALGVVLVAFALGLIYLVDPFALWPPPLGGEASATPQKPEAATAGEPLAEAPKPEGEVLIQKFELVHIGNSEDRAVFSGSLFQFRQPQENDDIQIQAEFSEPVYCFLLALNPDGVKQLCYPSDSSIAQAEPIQTLRYPATVDSAFGLTDGAGQQAFVLYASRGPLPSFDAWQNELVAANWPSPEINGNWVYRAGQLQAIENSLSARPLTRGEVRQTKTPTPFKQWCDSLRQAEGTDVRGVTFVVQPKS